MDQWGRALIKKYKAFETYLHKIQHCCTDPQRPICGVFFLAPFTAASCRFLRTNQEYTNKEKYEEERERDGR